MSATFVMGDTTCLCVHRKAKKGKEGEKGGKGKDKGSKEGECPLEEVPRDPIKEAELLLMQK